MQYLVRWKDADGQDQEQSFARKTERTKWIRKQQKQDPMVKYTTVDEEKEMSEQVEQELPEQYAAEAANTTDEQVEEVLRVQDETTGQPMEEVEWETPVEEDQPVEEPKPAPKAEKSPMAGKRVKVRLTMTAEVDYDAFKAYFGYTDEELKNFALHGIVRSKSLAALEEFGRHIDEAGTITFAEAKQ